MTVDEKKAKNIYINEIALIEKTLKGLLENRKPKSLYIPCAYILDSGGKHLRPFLVLISAMAVGGKSSAVKNAAIAVEILHNFTLVHDDIMDNSSKRRGKPTLHKKYDLSTAILAGDSMIALAYENLLKDLEHCTKEVISTFTHGIIEVCEGQSLDKEFEKRSVVSIKEYKEMIYKKTAALAQMCCSIGAQLCLAPEEQIKKVANYGKYLGMAFQIQDDLLDITAEENELGKTIGSDLLEAKKTYLFLKALEKAKGKDKVELIKVIRQRGIKRSEIAKYRTLYTKLGVLADAEREILKYTKLALKNLSSLPGEDGKELMRWLANNLISRKK